MTSYFSQHDEALHALCQHFTGSIITPQGANYEQARRVWNMRLNKRPALIARCAGEQDVVHTIRVAREYHLPFSVRSGGHDITARSLCDDGLVIDLSAMHAVTIDPATATAHVQGGATIHDLVAPAQTYGFATTTGTISSVGLAGLTLGGGYGSLMGKCGLTIDNLLSAQVVTADSQVLTASATENSELFWAIRGGGGNFGVMTAMRYRLYPISTVLAGPILYSPDQARQILCSYRTLIRAVPDELTIQIFFVQMPGVGPVLMLLPVYCGPLAEGERALQPFRQLGPGTPLADQVQPMAYADVFKLLDSSIPYGVQVSLKTQSVNELSDEIIDTLIEHAQRSTSPMSGISIHHFHGTASRVGVHETAFATRHAHHLIEIVAVWDKHDPQDQQHVQWAQQTSQALAPYALEGGYVNLLDESEQARIPLSYGPNYPRLLEAKRVYDPANVFNAAVASLTR